MMKKNTNGLGGRGHAEGAAFENELRRQRLIEQYIARLVRNPHSRRDAAMLRGLGLPAGTVAALQNHNGFAPNTKLGADYLPATRNAYRRP